jgi:hypothetical protein
MRALKILFFGMFLLANFTQAWAGKAEDEELARTQRQLNKEVMEKPFFAEEPEKVEAYIKEASKNHIKPLEYTGPHWLSGYTCHDMLRYSWNEYRDCNYYHHYYGHYYRYH